MIIGISGRIGSGKDTIATIIQGLNSSLDYDVIIHHVQKGEPFDSSTGFERKSFADKLKEIVSLLLGIPREDLDKIEVKNSLLPDEWQVYDIYHWNKKTAISKQTEEEAIRVIEGSNSQHNYTYKKTERTVRWLLQYIGTDLFRNQLHQNVHVNALFADYKPTNKKGLEHHTWNEDQLPNWIITDNRFPNECKAIKDRGGILIRIERNFDIVPDANGNPMTVPKVNIQHESETALDNYKDWDYIINNDGTINQLVEMVETILKKEKII